MKGGIEKLKGEAVDGRECVQVVQEILGTGYGIPRWHQCSVQIENMWLTHKYHL